MSDDDDLRFAKYLTRVMSWRGLKTIELARMLEIGPSTVSKWRTGRFRPNTWYCRRLAEVLNLDPEEVLAQAGHLDPRASVNDPVKDRLHDQIDALPSDILEPYIAVFDRLLNPAPMKAILHDAKK